MSGFVKLYATILDSSIWSEAAETRLVFITMLAMADVEGYVMAAVPGIARRANLALDAVEAALGVLEAPDPYDRSGVEDGRRIIRVPGGWRLTNYERYREMRTEAQIANAERQQRWRDRSRGAVTHNESNGASREVSTSSSSPSGSSDPEQQQEPVGREPSPAAVELYQLVGDYDFGPYADMVLALVKVQRSPAAVVAVLRAHLTGLDYPIAAAGEVGLACQEYLATAGSTFNPSHFAGFVRRARGRRKLQQEAQTIDREQAAKVERQQEDEEARRTIELVRRFEEQHPARAGELQRQAESWNADSAGQFGHSLFVRATYHQYVKAEVNRAETA